MEGEKFLSRSCQCSHGAHGKDQVIGSDHLKIQLVFLLNLGKSMSEEKRKGEQSKGDLFGTVLDTLNSQPDLVDEKLFRFLLSFAADCIIAGELIGARNMIIIEGIIKMTDTEAEPYPSPSEAVHWDKIMTTSEHALVAHVAGKIPCSCLPA